MEVDDDNDERSPARKKLCNPGSDDSSSEEEIATKGVLDDSDDNNNGHADPPATAAEVAESMGKVGPKVIFSAYMLCRKMDCKGCANSNTKRPPIDRPTFDVPGLSRVMTGDYPPPHEAHSQNVSNHASVHSATEIAVGGHKPSSAGANMPHNMSGPSPHDQHVLHDIAIGGHPSSAGANTPQNMSGPSYHEQHFLRDVATGGHRPSSEGQLYLNDTVVGGHASMPRSMHGPPSREQYFPLDMAVGGHPSLADANMAGNMSEPPRHPPPAHHLAHDTAMGDLSSLEGSNTSTSSSVGWLDTKNADGSKYTGSTATSGSINPQPGIKKAPTCSTRRSGRQKNPEADWVTVKEFPLREKDSQSTHDALTLARNDLARYLRKQSTLPIEKESLWKGYKGDYEDDGEGGFSQKYQCRYKSRGDCNCMYKEVYKAGSGRIVLKWYVKGSAHGITTGPTFSNHEEHANFMHVRANEDKNKDTTLPLEMEEFIRKRMYEFQDIPPSRLLNDLKDAAISSDDKTKLFPFDGRVWQALKAKIYSAHKSTKAKIKKHLGQIHADTAADIDSWVKENNYDVLVTALGDKFDEDTMFVAASDISVDSVPSDPNSRKDWEPTLSSAKIFITSITMSCFLPAASTGINVFYRIMKNSDTTYNIFTVDDFKCAPVAVYDGASNAKVIGFLVSIGEAASDYYFAEAASKAVTEHICTLEQSELPGGVTQLPFGLLSPCPPSTRKHPLTLDPETEKFYQPYEGDFFVAKPSRRYLTRQSVDARKCFTDDVRHYVAEPLQLEAGTRVTTYRSDIEDFEIANLSDGAKAIPNGLQAANPCMGEVHIDCWNHLGRDVCDTINGKGRNKDKKPVFDWDRESKDRPPYHDKSKKMMYRYIMRRLLKVKRSRHRQLANLIMEDLVSCLRDNRVYYTKDDEYILRYPGIDENSWDKFVLEVAADEVDGIHLPGAYGNVADYLEAKLQRITKQGSHGYWRLSDVCDRNLSEDTTDDDIVDPTMLCHNVTTSPDSLEAGHRWFKAQLVEKGHGGEKRGTVCAKLSCMMEVGREYGRNERDHYGVPIDTPAFGQGSYGRVPSTRYAEPRRIGMLFTGQNGTLNEPSCQIDLLDSSRLFVDGMDTVLYLVNGEKELEDLDDALTLQVNEGTVRIDMDNREEKIEAKKKILRKWFTKYKRIRDACRTELEKLVEEAAEQYYREKAKLSKDEPIPQKEKRDPNIWAICLSLGVAELDSWEQTFAAVSPLDIDEDGTKFLGPFRQSLDRAENIVYRWRCNCHYCLEDGLCEHVIFVQHIKWPLISDAEELSGFTGTKIPISMINYDLKFQKAEREEQEMINFFCNSCH